MAKKLTPLPVSKARNAYELMQEVNRTILEEPKRLYMGSWVTAFKETRIETRLSDRMKFCTPSCGTVGCYAGWVTLLKLNQNLYSMAEEEALVLLTGERYPVYDSVEYRLRSALDNAFCNTEVYADPFMFRELTPGTRAYARAVVKRFRAIMDQYEDVLKAVTYPLKEEL